MIEKSIYTAYNQTVEMSYYGKEDEAVLGQLMEQI